MLGGSSVFVLLFVSLRKRNSLAFGIAPGVKGTAWRTSIIQTTRSICQFQALNTICVGSSKVWKEGSVG